MRIVQSPDEFVESFLGAQREAAASFGVNTILLEKYITQPRHIEVQVIFFSSFSIILSIMRKRHHAFFFIFSVQHVWKSLLYARCTTLYILLQEQ